MARRRLAGFGVLALFAVACQWVVGIDEKTSSVQPANIPLADASADANDAAPAECSKNLDCVTRRGANWVCVRPEGACRSLLDGDCEVVLAGSRGAPLSQKQEVLLDDDTIFFGFIADLRGSGKNAGLARRQAVELAVSDVHSVTQGIPGGASGQRRPIAFVTCSETKDATSAPDPKVAARHLIDDLHVPAIIGASNSDTTINVFNGEALPKGTLLFSPNALASSLSSPEDRGLFWRTSTTSVLQGRAIRAQITAVEAQFLAGGAVAPLKLAIVQIGDVFGQDILPHVRSELTFNGVALETGVNGPTCLAAPCAAGSRVFQRQYPANPQGDVLQGLAAEVHGFAPHVVVAIGRQDAVQIAAGIEAFTPAPAPMYIFTQGAETPDLTTLLTAFDTAGIRARVRGTRPLAAPETATVFVPLYKAQFPEGPASGNGVPGAYDIAYLLTYAALAAGPGTMRLDGARMNEGLKRVVDRAATTIVKVGTPDLSRGLDAISAGQTINVKGLSYIGDFDPGAGEAPGKVDVWCISPANTFKSSGVVYDPVDGGVTTGTFACP